MESDQTHISVPNNMSPDPNEAPHSAESSKPMSAAQASRLKMLSAELGVPIDLDLNDREAMKRIEELERRSSRGAPKDA